MPAKRKVQHTATYSPATLLAQLAYSKLNYIVIIVPRHSALAKIVILLIGKVPIGVATLHKSLSYCSYKTGDDSFT